MSIPNSERITYSLAHWKSWHTCLNEVFEGQTTTANLHTSFAAYAFTVSSRCFHAAVSCHMHAHTLLESRPVLGGLIQWLSISTPTHLYARDGLGRASACELHILRKICHVDVTSGAPRASKVTPSLVLRGEGRISPATPRNQNNDQPSRGDCQKQRGPDETKPNAITTNPRKAGRVRRATPRKPTANVKVDSNHKSERLNIPKHSNPARKFRFGVAHAKITYACSPNGCEVWITYAHGQLGGRHEAVAHYITLILVDMKAGHMEVCAAS